MNSSALFQPFKYKSLELKNRIVMAPMTRRTSPGGIPDALSVSYYEKRAKGEVGLILSEGTTIHRPSASGHESIPNFHDPNAIEGWRKILQAVHAAGAKMAPQLWHQGQKRLPGTGPHPESPSEGPSPLSEVNEKPMSEKDIADTIEAFAKAAKTAEKIGFDAVELHGAHGYLIDEFLWDQTNLRSDQWGGSPNGRARFGAEIVKEIRRQVSPHFPILFRFSQFKIDSYKAKIAPNPKILEEILTPLSEAGVDIFHASTRRVWEPEYPGSDLNLAGWAKKITGKPSITVGSVGSTHSFLHERGDQSDTNQMSKTDLEKIFRQLQNGEFDLIAVGRALIADPEWPIKIREGREKEIKLYDKSDLSNLRGN